MKGKKREYGARKGRPSFRDSMTKDEELSRSMSWALRHAAPSLGLSIGSDGFVAVSELLSCNHPRFNGKSYTLEDVKRVVEHNEKKRFELVEEGKNNCPMIRACQGHSIQHVSSEELLTPILQDELKYMDRIIHGTTKQAWEIIRREGLKRMSRNHIHFATALPGEEKNNSTIISGIRAKREIDVYLDVKKCAADAVQFYRSKNEVILCAGVNEDGLLPLQYISKVIEVQSGNILFQNEQSSS